MKFKISKEQFNDISLKLIKKFIGDLHFMVDGVKTKDYQRAKELEVKGDGSDFLDIMDSSGENIMDIWMKGRMVPKKCKTLLNCHFETVEGLEQFMPIMRKKEFAKAIAKHLYEQLNFKVDCIEYRYSFEKEYDETGDLSSIRHKNYVYKPYKNKNK